MGPRGRLARTWLLLLGLTAALLTPACGGGGGESPSGIAGGNDASFGLEILTDSLPPADVDQFYAPLRLEVDAAESAAFTWSIWEGSLPPGIQLEADGLLHGKPTHEGVSVFSVHVSDGHSSGLTTLALAVGDLALYARSGLLVGEAWSGKPVRLATAGAEGPVSYHVLTDASGGRLILDPDDASLATWTPGETGGRDVEDVIEVREVEGDRVRRLTLPVSPDPTAGHEAEFGASDVWYINTERKYGSHGFGTDFQAALAAVGLRTPGSTGPIGSAADQVAELWVRLAVLKRLSAFYLRSEDGPAGAAGLPLSFPFDEPGPGYMKPQIGGLLSGASHHFSEISLLDGGQEGIVGTAFVDAASNAQHENDTSRAGADLGVFVNHITAYFRMMNPSLDLVESPIDEDDLAALRALLHGRATEGERAEELRALGTALAQVFAVVLAHEIGHSLGLEHTTYTAPNSLMSAAAPIAPWSTPAFLGEDVDALRARLPGPGRMTSGPTQSKLLVPAGGVSVCNHRRCNLRLPRGGPPSRR